jgi:hypothetical protein
LNEAAEIPANFVNHARQHLRRTGRPLLYGPRRRSDIGLLACPNPASARWVLLTDTPSLPGPLEEAILAEECIEVGPSAELMVKLTKYAAIAVDGLPSLFQCQSQVIGHLQVCDGVPFVSEAVALSCLSFVLRHHEPRTGFFVRVPGPD